jgi:hypothetical protein
MKTAELSGPSIVSMRQPSIISRPRPLRTCSKMQSWHCILCPATAPSCGLTPKSCRCSDTRQMNILGGILPSFTSTRRRSLICLSACPAMNSLSSIQHACARRTGQFGMSSSVPTLASAMENLSTPAASRSTSPKGCGPKSGCASKKNNTSLRRISTHQSESSKWMPMGSSCARMRNRVGFWATHRMRWWAARFLRKSSIKAARLIVSNFGGRSQVSWIVTRLKSAFAEKTEAMCGRR